MDLDILLKVEQALKEDEKKTIDHTNLRITKGTFEKIMAYAKVVSRMAGSGMECYGYLLTPRDSLDGLITDIYFANDQEAHSAYVRVTEEGVFHTLRDTEALGYKIVGWWHSHGTMPTFHSGTDVNNFLTILHGIAPLTMFRNEEAVFALNNVEKRLEFDNYILTGTNVEQLKRIKIIKKIEQDPFAFSLVVNQFGDYYRERITKTRQGKEFVVNHPTHPKVEIVDIDNDVRFFIDQIEKDVFFKIKINGRSARDVFAEFNNRTSDVGKMYESLIKRFLESAISYINLNGDKSSIVKAVLHQDGRSLIERIKTSIEDQIDLTDKSKLEQDIINYFNRTRLNINTPVFNALERDQFEALYLLRFMKKFSDGIDKNSSFEKLTSDLERLEQVFGKALQTAKALVSYATEIFTDYYKIQNHKYRLFISGVLNRLCTNGHVSITQSVKDQLSNNNRGVKDFFLYDDRRQITNQLLMAGLNYPQTQPRSIVSFLEEFTTTYQTSPEKCDQLIEQRLLSGFGECSKYQDSSVVPRRKQFGGKIYGMFSGGKNARASSW